jgi:hypothetical protein
MKNTAPHFEAKDFGPAYLTTGLGMRQAAFANRLVRLIEGDFKVSLFSRALYNDLAQSFGFIAHYDRDGFYAAQMSSKTKRIAFLATIYRGGDYSGKAGVEAVFRGHLWVRSKMEYWQSLQAKAVEKTERAELTRLKEKYEDGLAV